MKIRSPADDHQRSFLTALHSLPNEALVHIARRLGLHSQTGQEAAEGIRTSGAGPVDVVVALLTADRPWFPSACASMGVHVHYGPPPAYPQRNLPLPTPQRTDDRRVLALLPECPLTTPSAIARWEILRAGVRTSTFLSRGGRTRDLREWSRAGWIVLSDDDVAPTQTQMIAAASLLVKRVDGRVLRWRRARETSQDLRSPAA